MKILFRVGAGVVILAAAGLAYYSSTAQSTTHSEKDFKKYNVLLISMDTTRKDHLSCYGYEDETTPNIDRLAKESLRYDNCVAVSNWTLPTHASMLSGLYPITHGARWVTQDMEHISGKKNALNEQGKKFISLASPAGLMSSDCQTLAETLNYVGYRTGAVVSNFTYVNKAFRLDQGFDHYDDRIGTTAARYRRADEITDEALTWLQESEQEKPFFMFLNYMDPHKIYSPPKPYDTKFAKGPSPFKLNTYKKRSAFYHKTRGAVMETGTGRPIRPEEHRILTQHYNGEIAFMDHHIGRLLDSLRQQNLYDNTLIFITADHGESLGEHQIMGHAFSMYEPEIAVPMLVKMPNSSRTGAIDYGVQHPDIMPTVLEVLELPPHTGVQGISMLNPSNRDLVACEYIFTQHVKRWKRYDYVQHALYRDGMKYIEYDSRTNPPELYNIQDDPSELVNLIASQPDVARELKAGLDRWREEYLPLQEMELGPTNDEHYKRMIQLGYAGE